MLPTLNSSNRNRQLALSIDQQPENVLAPASRDRIDPPYVLMHSFNPLTGRVQPLLKVHLPPPFPRLDNGL